MPDRATSSQVLSEGSNEAALGGLVKISRRKRLLIRAIESIARPLLFLSERLKRSNADTSGEVRNILVLEYWNLGDIVMELPFLRNLRLQYSKARIVLLTSPKAAPLLEHQGLVDEVIVVRVPWAQHYSRWKKYNPFSPLWIELVRTLKLLRAQFFDLAFSARADIRENLIIWLVKARRRVGYGFGGGGVFLTDVVTPDLLHPHFSARWLRLLEHLGKPILVRKPSLHLSQEEERFAEEYLAQQGVLNGEFLVGVHSGARSANRQWGQENFAAVAQRLQAQFPIKILWFQDPQQTLPLQDGDHFLSLSLPLRRFLAVLSRCRLLICNDSGPMHIATALNVPAVVVFGPTEPAWFGPLGQENQVVIRPGFWCRPCFDYCLFDQPYCLRTISTDSVFEASATSLKALLQRGRDNGRSLPAGKLKKGVLGALKGYR
jgi:ADP-heptose:LPS heptosyltransferase